MKLKVALFGRMDTDGYLCIFAKEVAACTKLIRTSAWVEVDFPEREDSPEAIQEEVAAIDQEMERVIENNMKSLQALKAKKTAALSKVFQPEVV
jgi:hypothetical protein